jgi:hypothetical protein
VVLFKLESLSTGLEIFLTCDWNLNCPLPAPKSVDLNNYCYLDLYDDFPERIVSLPRGESLLPATILSFLLEVDITLIYEKLE